MNTLTLNSIKNRREHLNNAVELLNKSLSIADSLVAEKEKDVDGALIAMFEFVDAAKEELKVV